MVIEGTTPQRVRSLTKMWVAMFARRRDLNISYRNIAKRSLEPDIMKLIKGTLIRNIASATKMCVALARRRDLNISYRNIAKRSPEPDIMKLIKGTLIRNIATTT